ncbi:transposase [Acuticoccus sp.]|uniref:transposase n=1 Tax=Acuticoccus sp. TaxID=1904378 RepID=UPI003B523A04
MAHDDLSDGECAMVGPLPPPAAEGERCLGDRRVLNGIGWFLRTASTWRDGPAPYGPSDDGLRSG